MGKDRMTVDVRRIPLYDFAAQYAPIRDEILAALTRVIDSQHVILGGDVALLETELASYCGAKYAIGCGSGSDALLLALMACDVGPGDAVITSPFTFFATAGAIARLHARPVFVDIDPATFNIDPAAVRAELQRRDDVKAILPVHLFGGCADMDPLVAAAREYGCKVIEDAAQSIGAEYKGRRAGSLGDLGCFSFYPTKNLGGVGEGGLVTTADAALAERLTALRVHGSRRRYFHDEVGLNSRLDTIQAAVLRVKAKYLDAWTAERQHNAAAYRQEGARRALPVAMPAEAPWQTRHVWNQFVIRAPRRDELRVRLTDAGVATEVYYPLPLHQQRCFAGLGYRSPAFPASEAAAGSVVALPVAPGTPRAAISYVCDVLEQFYA